MVDVVGGQLVAWFFECWMRITEEMPINSRFTLNNIQLQEGILSHLFRILSLYR